MELLARVREVFGGFDTLVNNADITSDGTFHDLDEGRGGRALDTDLPTAFNTTLTAVPAWGNRSNGRPPSRGRLPSSGGRPGT